MSSAQLHLSFLLPNAGQRLKCRYKLRYLPGKRLVCSAELVPKKDISDMTSEHVVAKLFIHRRKPRRHWRRESEGLRILDDNHIPSPKVIYSGKITCETGDRSVNELTVGRSFYVILLNLLPDPTSLRDIWHSGEELRNRVFWLRKALILLAQQHNKGVVQKDLHLGNFLISEGRVFIVDGDSVTALNRPLDMEETWRWVGVFFAQIFPKYDYLLNELLPDYCAARDVICDSAALASVSQSRETQRDKIRKSHIEKIYRDSGICRVSKGPFHLVCCNRDCFSPSVWALIHQLGQEIKNRGRARGSWETVLEGQKYLIQYFPSNASSDRTWLPENGASIRWRAANIKKVFGEETESPVGLYIRKIGPLHLDGCYVSEKS